MAVEDNKLSGSVERITYYNDENGYSVIRLKPDSRKMLPYSHGVKRDQLATVVGNLPELQPGEWVEMDGKWSRHAKHGWQFSAESCHQSRPASIQGIKRYLGSGLVKGVGPKMAERIVNLFGENTLEIIDNDPDQLLNVLGIGKKRVQGIKKAWDDQRAIQEVMLFLQTHGVSTSLAIKIYKEYGDEALNVVQETPYKMVNDVRGIGFKTADKIARQLGLAHDDPGRIEAGIAYTLNRMAAEGHVYVPQEELEPVSAEILSVPLDSVKTIIDQLDHSELIQRETIRYELSTDNAERGMVKEEEAVYLTGMYYSEIGVTQRVTKLVEHQFSRVRAGLTQGQVKRTIQSVMSQSGMKLAEMQHEAVIAALKNKVTVVTGGPGTGKTTSLRTLLDILDRLGKSYQLASPTGRAAKRLTEATGRQGQTIHRMLDFQPGTGFGKNEYNLIDADMVIVDEASMLDLVLANNLLKAVGKDSHLLLVGDVDQLPSVGPGDVLRDLIASEVPAVVRLEVVFRQSAESLIIQNAHRINQGEMPQTSKIAKDFFIFVKDDPMQAADLLVDVVKTRIPQKFGLNAFDDVQVLAPMYNGHMGVTNLNAKIQAALNPPNRKPERRQGGRVFRVGDKVMQVVNNYDKGVFNGDIGRIVALDSVQQTLTLNVDGMPVLYEFLELDELVHAYAISVHKSQGSEYPCVVIPMTTQHYLMLQRNLLYTAVTRAKKVCILIGTRKAIRIAIQNQKTRDRHTALDWRLTK